MKPLAALLAVAFLLPAQTPRQRRGAPAQPAASGLAIGEITVTGVKRFTPQQVVAMTGMKLGEQAVASTFENARDRILATGCIESFGWKFAPDAQGRMSVTLEITELDQYLPWTFDRLNIPAADFAARAAKELPCFGKEIPTTDRYLDQAARLVTKMLSERGIAEPALARINIAGKDSAGKDVIAVVFQPRSPAPSIAEVRFTGTKAIEERYLRKQATELARGVPYSELLFRQMLDNQIRPMYESVGRLQVRFGEIKTEPARDVKGAVVTVEVNEGPVFNLEDVQVNGTPFSPEEIEELGKFKRGERVSYTDIGLAMERVFVRMKNAGYLKVAYKARRELNMEKSTAKLFIDVEPGPQYRMGKLTLNGLDVVSEPVIRKMWTLQTGDPFRADYPDFFLNTVKERGVFDFLAGTQAKTALDDERHTVDVTLIFKGGAQPLDSRKRR